MGKGLGKWAECRGCGVLRLDVCREERHEEQVWAVEQVLSAVRSPRILRKGSWLVAAATLLLGHAFFAIITPTTNKVCLY